MTSCHVIASWYFDPDSATEGIPCCKPVTLVGLKRSMFNYLGSIAFGSLIVAILEALYYTVSLPCGLPSRLPSRLPSECHPSDFRLPSVCHPTAFPVATRSQVKIVMEKALGGQNIVIKMIACCFLCILGCIKARVPPADFPCDGLPIASQSPDRVPIASQSRPIASQSPPDRLAIASQSPHSRLPIALHLPPQQSRSLLIPLGSLLIRRAASSGSPSGPTATSPSTAAPSSRRAARSSRCSPTRAWAPSRSPPSSSPCCGSAASAASPSAWAPASSPSR